MWLGSPATIFLGDEVGVGKLKVSTMPSNKRNYSYQDILRINNRRKKELNLSLNLDKIKTIHNLDIEKGQVISNLYEVDSIEHFLYEFLKKGFIIKNPEELSDYNFDNLRLYTNPDEFKRDLTNATNNTAFFGMELIFNSFILRRADDGWEITGYTYKEVTFLVIPDFVTSIGDSAFANLKELGSVILPKGLKSIGERAFYACCKLHSIRLPNGLKSIGDTAFCGCYQLCSIRLPKSLKHIGKGSFAWCGLTEIIIPDGITVIDFQSFANTPIEKVILPKGLKEIGDGAFYATSLMELHIPSVEIIDKWAFYECKLKGILRFPENLKKCYASSFPKNATAIYIPKGVDYVKDIEFGKLPNIVEY